MEKTELKILIVEDDFVLAANLKENLNSMGYGKVFHAANSTDGIRLFKSIDFDLCLVDIQLNKSPMDGIQMVAEGKMSEKVPVIYLSSFIDSNTRDRAKLTRPAGYLVKPSTTNQIDVAMEMALNSNDNYSEIAISHQCPRIVDNDIIFLKVKTEKYERYEKHNINDFHFFKAEGSYTRVYSKDKMTFIAINLKKTLSIVQRPTIIRCHKSYAVNLQHIHSIDNKGFYIMQDKEIVLVPIGDEYRCEISLKIKKM
jgi:DNA-binding LytR/AlgR family response regulator